MPPSKPPQVVTLRQFRKVLRQVLSDWLYRWPNLLLEQFPELHRHEGMLRALVQAYYDVLYYRLHYALWASAEGAALHTPPHWARMPHHPLSEICLN